MPFRFYSAIAKEAMSKRTENQEGCRKMGIDIVFLGNPERLGIKDITYGCFSARSMIEYLPEELNPMSHLPWSKSRIWNDYSYYVEKLRNYVELLRDYTRYRDPTWDLRWNSHGVYALRQFIRIAKQYLQYDIPAYISM